MSQKSFKVLINEVHMQKFTEFFFNKQQTKEGRKMEIKIIYVNYEKIMHMKLILGLLLLQKIIFKPTTYLHK